MANNLKESARLLFESWVINIDELPIEEMIVYTAIGKYLQNRDDLSPDAENSDKVHYYVEALHQLCNVKNWILVDSMINLPITTTTETAEFSLPFAEYLLFKNLFTKLLEISNEIIANFQHESNQLIQIQIFKAKALSGTGNLTESKNIYKQLLNQDINPLDRLEIDTYLVICDVQSEKFSKSVPILIDLLVLIEKFNLRYFNSNNENKKLCILTAQLLSNLGYCRMNASSFNEADILYSRALSILKENNSMNLIVNPLVHKGIVSRKKFRAKDSINILQEAMKIAIEIDNEESIIWISHHLAWALRIDKKHKKAKENGLISLEGYRKINDLRGINDCHELLGWIYIDEGSINNAINEFERSLKWREQNDRPQGMASCLLGLAVAYLRKGKLIKCVKMIFIGLKLYHKAGILNWTRIYRMLNFTRIFRHLLRVSEIR